MSLCIQVQLPDVEIELDAKSIVDLLNSSSVSIADHAPLVDDCRNLMNQIPKWKLKHCFREANACADQLARMALHLQQPFVLLDTPPLEVSSLLLYDISGCNRICTNAGPWLCSCSLCLIYNPRLPKKKKSMPAKWGSKVSSNF